MKIEITCLLALTVLVSVIPAYADGILTSASTDKDHYNLGDTVIISGSVSEREYLDETNIQKPINITVSSSWDADIKIYLDENLKFNNSFSLDPKVGFEQGIYKLNIKYNDSTYDSTFSVGDGYKLRDYEKTTFPPKIIIEKEPECIFNSYIEKSWVFFGDRPWISGFVIDCDENIEYHLKDFVHVRILDIDGNQLQEEIHNRQMSDSRTQKFIDDGIYTKYKLIENVHRGYGILGENADTTEAETIYLDKNQYFLYLPQIHSVDFEHRQTYFVEISYGKHVNLIPFVTLHPDINYKSTVDEICENYDSKITEIEYHIGIFEDSAKRFNGIKADNFLKEIESLENEKKNLIQVCN